MPVFQKLIDEYDPVQYEKMVNGFELLNKFLEEHDYVAGNNLTIADCVIVASVTAAEVISIALCKIKNYF